MTDDTELRNELLLLIDGRREAIEAYLREARPRRNRLTNVSIVSSAVAALFVAGPALGGAGFASSVQQALDLRRSSLVWQVACLVALVVSLISMISTNLSRSHDLAGRVAAAESCRADLEGLRAFLQFGGLSVPDAAELYRQYVARIPFVTSPPLTSQLPVTARSTAVDVLKRVPDRQPDDPVERRQHEHPQGHGEEEGGK